MLKARGVAKSSWVTPTMTMASRQPNDEMRKAKTITIVPLVPAAQGHEPERPAAASMEPVRYGDVAERAARGAHADGDHDDGAVEGQE